MKLNEHILIDNEKCLGCGACADNCIGKLITIIDGIARVEDRNCILCGHCVAVCPVGACIIKDLADSGNQAPGSMTEFDPNRLLLAMKSRRSIRSFKATPLSDEILSGLLDAARYAPTAKNRQDVYLTVIRDRLSEIESEAVATFRRALSEELPISKRVRNMGEIRDDHFFHGAPMAILFSSRSSVDASLAAAYVELLAESMGLGCLYSGYFIYAVSCSEKLQELMNIPDECVPVTAIVIGYPSDDIKFFRIPGRNPSNAVIL